MNNEPTGPDAVTISLQLSPEVIDALRNDPTTNPQSKAKFYERLGWFQCALIAIKESQRIADGAKLVQRSKGAKEGE